MILDTNFLKFQNSLGSSSPYQGSILISTRLKKEKKRITETLESLKLWFAALISRFHPRFREHGCWKHVADSSPISRNFKRRGTQNERARILSEIQRERERESCARVDSLVCTGYGLLDLLLFLPVHERGREITARSRSTTREMGTRTDPSYTTVLFPLPPRIFARGNCFSSLRS